MEDDFVKRLREQERILGELQENALGWLDELLQEAFNPEDFLRYAAILGIDMDQPAQQFDERPNPYKVLDLDKTATDEDVRKRYRELLKKLHPDTAGTEGTSFLLNAVIEAYRRIGNERGW